METEGSERWHGRCQSGCWGASCKEVSGENRFGEWLNHEVSFKYGELSCWFDNPDEIFVSFLDMAGIQVLRKH